MERVAVCDAFPKWLRKTGSSGGDMDFTEVFNIVGDLHAGLVPEDARQEMWRRVESLVDGLAQRHTG